MRNIFLFFSYFYFKNNFSVKFLHFIFYGFIFCGFCTACGSEPKMQNDGPDYAIKRWQGLVDSSNYEAAKAFSTPRTIKWLEKNKMVTEAGDSLGYQLVFQKINCSISGDSAVCNCIYSMRGDTTTYKDVYLAKKINDKWVVDLNNDEVETF